MVNWLAWKKKNLLFGSISHAYQKAVAALLAHSLFTIHFFYLLARWWIRVESSSRFLFFFFRWKRSKSIYYIRLLANNLQAFFKLFNSLFCRLRNGNSTRIKECINFPCSAVFFLVSHLKFSPLAAYYWSNRLSWLLSGIRKSLFVCGFRTKPIRYPFADDFIETIGKSIWMWNRENLPTAKRNDQKEGCV